ncbi:MAG TPA: magnesium chelatase, partial [Bacteroidota bacterium]
EDYTNRGNLITPLKDRIDSQILTHYPRTLEEAIEITAQEAWIHRNGREMVIPQYFREIIECIAFEARKSEFVDQKSGVSARLTISAMENLISNAERRAILLKDSVIVPRICDLPHTLPGLTGKIELVFEGEQEGPVKISKALIGKAVREVFRKYFPDPLERRQKTHGDHKTLPLESEYAAVIGWFEGGNRIEVSDDMTVTDYHKELDRVKGLRELTKKHMKIAETDKAGLASSMEFVLDGLHQSSRIAKDEVDHVTAYKDLVQSIFTGKGKAYEEDL